MKDRLYTLWETLYGDRGGTGVFFAPGRVNLLGEHTDCYGGFVLPCAVDQGTWVIGRRRTDSLVRVWSNNFPQEDSASFDLSELVYVPDHRWVNYPKSSIWALAERNIRLPSGVDAIYWGNLPGGGEPLYGPSVGHYGSVRCGSQSTRIWPLPELRYPGLSSCPVGSERSCPPAPGHGQATRADVVTVQSPASGNRLALPLNVFCTISQRSFTFLPRTFGCRTPRQLFCFPRWRTYSSPGGAC
ncbi:MAG: hypothetical protein CSA35_04605 [Dethiosulfovibrio peptidovorans]|nr:MAG: hypothetical protein CSA35_04605 [Dethiosulfovibrio peptidovorans]